METLPNGQRLESIPAERGEAIFRCRRNIARPRPFGQGTCLLGGSTLTKASRKVRIGIVGVGDCASSLVQGISFYRDVRGNEPVPGLMPSGLFMKSPPQQLTDAEARQRTLDFIAGENEPLRDTVQ